MKKIYFLMAMMLFGAASLKAQSATDLQFVYIDAKGNETGVVANNAVITVNTVEGDPNDEYADPFISSGLAVKNTANGGRRVQVEYEITALPNGRHDICFFGSCLTDTKTGEYSYPRLSNSGNITGLNALKAGSVTSLKAEWYFIEPGTTTVVYKANVCKDSGKMEGITPIYEVVAEGPTVTVNYTYDPTGIADITIDNPVKTEYFNMAGCRVAQPAEGIYVVRNTYANGKVAITKERF